MHSSSLVDVICDTCAFLTIQLQVITSMVKKELVMSRELFSVSSKDVLFWLLFGIKTI